MIDQDIRTQKNAQRSLEISFREAVQLAVMDGLQPDYVIQALEGLLIEEKRLKQSRDVAERSYA